MATTKVNWPDVETAFERNSPGLNSYIEKATGEVLVVVDGQTDDEEKRRRIAEHPEGYIRIEPASSREQYRWMERFVASVEDPVLRDRLLISIDGKGAFRRFKDVLLSFPPSASAGSTTARTCCTTTSTAGLRLVPTRRSSRAVGAVQPPPEPTRVLTRTSPTGEGPADVLRKQVKGLIDVLPAGELHSARVFSSTCATAAAPS